MTAYDFAQLEQLWVNAGGPAAVEKTAAAIAEAESGGNEAAMNYTDNGGTQTSVGIWQVSTGTHQFPASWTTATGNASEAVTKYDDAGDTFTPWGTYDSGVYTQFLSGASPSSSGVPVSSASAGGGTSSSFNPLNPTTWIPSVLSGIGVTSDIEDVLERGALMLFGAILVVIGVVRISGGSSPKQAQAAPVTETAAPETEAAEVAA